MVSSSSLVGTSNADVGELGVLFCSVDGMHLMAGWPLSRIVANEHGTDSFILALSDMLMLKTASSFVLT